MSTRRNRGRKQAGKGMNDTLIQIQRARAGQEVLMPGVTGVWVPRKQRRRRGRVVVGLGVVDGGDGDEEVAAVGK